MPSVGIMGTGIVTTFEAFVFALPALHEVCTEDEDVGQTQGAELTGVAVVDNSSLTRLYRVCIEVLAQDFQKFTATFNFDMDKTSASYFCVPEFGLEYLHMLSGITYFPHCLQNEIGSYDVIVTREEREKL
uniref:Uncharacterized protein n=1 Tax=Glossina pallidipes TaxID=7398 RepID=A0A1A9ZFL1_GLOPL